MTREPTAHGDESTEPDATDRLDSWKDVAAYLQRDVSTVQRWERRERLPIHRQQHDKLGSVYAFRHEIDAWRTARSRRLDAPSELEKPDEPTGQPRPSPLRRGRRRSVRIAATAAAGAVVVLAGWLPSSETGTGSGVRRPDI